MAVQRNLGTEFNGVSKVDEIVDQFDEDKSMFTEFTQMKSIKIIILLSVIFIFSKLIRNLIDFFAISTVYGYSMFAYFVMLLTLWSILPQNKSYVYNTSAMLSSDWTKILFMIIGGSVFYLSIF